MLQVSISVNGIIIGVVNAVRQPSHLNGAQEAILGVLSEVYEPKEQQL